MRWLSLIGMSSSAISTSKMVPDPLLSFLYNAPAADKSGDIQLGSSTEVSLEEENSENTSLDRYTKASTLEYNNTNNKCVLMMMQGKNTNQSPPPKIKYIKQGTKQNTK